MAYPEAIPRLNAHQTEEFHDRFDQFRLTKEQRELYQTVFTQLEKGEKK